MPSDSELSEVLSIKTNPFSLSRKNPPKPPSSLGIQNRTRNRSQQRPVVQPKSRSLSQPTPLRQIQSNVRQLESIPTPAALLEIESTNTYDEDRDFIQKNNPEVNSDITIDVDEIDRGDITSPENCLKSWFRAGFYTKEELNQVVLAQEAMERRGMRE